MLDTRIVFDELMTTIMDGQCLLRRLHREWDRLGREESEISLKLAYEIDNVNTFDLVCTIMISCLNCIQESAMAPAALLS